MGVLAVGFVGCAVFVGQAAEDVGEAVDEAADDFEESQREREREIAEDVELGACRVDDLGFMVADLTVTNNSSERSNYSVEVTFEGPDGSQLGTGAALVSALEPGQSTAAEAGSLTEPASEFTCRVVDVTRFSDQLGESPRDEEIAEDVELGACRVDDLGFMVADLTVTNNSSERSNYSVEVTFEGPDGSQLGTGAVFVSALEPGQSTAQEANSLSQPAGEFTCRVVDVSRFSDE